MIDRRYKTFWRRLGAIFIDGLIWGPITAGATWAYREIDASVAVALVHVLANVMPLTYDIAMHARFGQTVGKMATGIMVIDASERRRITPRQAIMRDVVWIGFLALALMVDLPDVLRGADPLDAARDRSALSFVDWAPLVWLLAEMITMLTNPRRRSLHDLIAGTVVVRLGVPSSANPSYLVERPA